MPKSRMKIVSYTKAPTKRDETRYTSDTPYIVHYLYDGVGYKERMYLTRTKHKNYFGFSKTKHVELGYVEAPEFKEAVA